MKNIICRQNWEKIAEKPVGGHWRRILVAWLISGCIAGITAVTVKWGQKHSQAVEMVYSRKIYPALAGCISRVTGVLPFSLAEWALYLLAFAAVFFVGLQIFRAFTRPAGICRLAKLSAVILAAAAASYFLFYACWGINFFRFSLAENLGWKTEPTDTAILQALCEKLIDCTNAAAEETLRDEENRCVLETDLQGTMESVAETWEQTAAEASFMGKGLYGKPKPVVFSLALSYQQITGIYVPYTFEANVNTMTTPALLPSTAAHECAHQRGFAREDEANFLGYWVCKHSNRPDLVYSGYLLATIHSINALAGADSEAYNAIHVRFSEKVSADLNWNNEFWKKFEGPIAESAEKRNDRYLKSNGQELGTKSYGRMVDLLIAEYLQEN